MTADDHGDPERKWLKHERFFVWIDNVYAAFAVLRIGRTIGFFDACEVASDFRGHGIQRMLIEARLLLCREKGLTMAYTYVRKENRWSRNNFLACGFEIERDDDQGDALTKFVQEPKT